MNSTIKKLYLNLKKEELFIKNNDHEVYHHLKYAFFSPIKNQKHEKLTVSESNINFFLICIEVIQFKLNKLCNGIE